MLLFAGEQKKNSDTSFQMVGTRNGHSFVLPLSYSLPHLYDFRCTPQRAVLSQFKIVFNATPTKSF